MRDKDHSRLLAGFLQGEHGATSTVQGWVAVVVRGGWRFADSDSVIQTILLELLELGRRGVIREDGGLRSYVQTVARHSCVDTFRREQLRVTSSLEDQHFELPDTSLHPHLRVELSQQLERLRFVWQALGQDCRRIMRWAFTDELTSAEIARRLEIKAGNARIRLHRCVQKARKLAEEHVR